jgi:GDPmannose 4,6-dehydratase
MNNKNVLISGVTGQAGSYLSEIFLNNGYKVYGITRRTSSPNIERIKLSLANPNFTIIEGDITDSFSVNDIVEKVRPAYIANAAAQSHVATSFEQPAFTWNATALGVLNILEAIRKTDKSIKLVQFSSSEMFGKNYSVKNAAIRDLNGLVTGFEYQVKYQDENTPMLPQSPYAIAKLAGHHLVRNYRESYGMNVCSAIFFNMESPRRGEKFVTRKITKWIGEFLQSPLGQCESLEFNDTCIFSSTLPGVVFPKLRLGNLNAYRDWGHAEEYMECVYTMLVEGKNRDYVLSTGKCISVADFLIKAFTYAGIKDCQNYIKIDESLKRPSEVDFLHGDSSLVRKELGWKPSKTIDDIVKEMVDHDKSAKAC